MPPLKVEKEFLRPFVEQYPYSWEDVDYVADRVIKFLEHENKPKHYVINAIEWILKRSLALPSHVRNEADFWCRIYPTKKNNQKELKMSNDENNEEQKNMTKEDLEKTMSDVEGLTDADREELFENMSTATANSLLEKAYQGSTEKITNNQVEIVRQVGCKLISGVIVNDIMKDNKDPQSALDYFNYYQSRIINQIQTFLRDIGDGKSDLVEFDRNKESCGDSNCDHDHKV